MGREQRARYPLKVGPSTSRFFAEVEALYGKPIAWRMETGWDRRHYGRSRVLDDGTPEVSLNAETGVTEATALHEVFHLMLRTRGYPVLSWRLRRPIDPVATRPHL